MMSGFPKKLIFAALVATYILLCFLPGSSADYSHGERSLWRIDCRDGKILGRRGGTFGYQGGITDCTKTNPGRSLRAAPSPPPPPYRRQAGTQQGSPPPSTAS